MAAAAVVAVIPIAIAVAGLIPVVWPIIEPVLAIMFRAGADASVSGYRDFRANLVVLDEIYKNVKKLNLDGDIKSNIPKILEEFKKGSNKISFKNMEEMLKKLAKIGNSPEASRAIHEIAKKANDNPELLNKAAESIVTGDIDRLVKLAPNPKLIAPVPPYSKLM